jgi:hypothetical protein
MLTLSALFELGNRKSVLIIVKKILLENRQIYSYINLGYVFHDLQ